MTANRVTIPLPTTPGGWPCIVADPPWSFRDKGSRIAPDQRVKRLARKGYRTLELDDLLAMDVRGIAAPDALLFLWTTSAHVLDGTSPEVARSWGFEPKATIAWVKARPMGAGDSGVWPYPRVQIGMGHYVRGAHELVIVARRGRARVLRRDVPSVFFAPRGRHSAKPEAFRGIVERLAAGPYLELFARTDRPAWMTWGDQAGRAA
jgi:N6-adenosine-specific RNA methylase IME4